MVFRRYRPRTRRYRRRSRRVVRLPKRRRRFRRFRRSLTLPQAARRYRYDFERLKLSDRLSTLQDWTIDWNHTASSVATSWAFRGNSTYDPDPTIFTTSAEKQTQLYSRYDRYIVNGCQIRVVVIAGSSDPLEVIVWPTRTSSPGLSDSWEGNRYMKRVIVSPVGRKFVIKNFASSKIMLGVHNPIDSFSHSAVGNANPTTLWYWHVGVRNMTGAEALTCVVQLRLRFYVTWYSPPSVEEA